MLGRGLDIARGLLHRTVRRTPVAYAVLALSLLLTGLAYYYVRHNVEAQERTRFEEITRSTERAVDRRMDAYVDSTLDGRGLFAASDFVTREEWRDYVAGSGLKERYPGIQAVAYAERVRSKAAHVEMVREEGFPDYALRPAGERYEYFPLKYVEPFDGENRALFGYDFYSDRVTRDAMEQARDTGLPRASGKVDLGAAGSPGQTGFFVYTPVYRDGSPAATPTATPTATPAATVDERRLALEGFIVSVFRTDELLRGIFGERTGHGVGPETKPGVDLEVFDGAEFTRETLLHDDDGVLRAGRGEPAARFTDTSTLEVAGRTWSLRFYAPSGFESGWQGNLPPFVLSSGLAISLMLFGTTWMLANSRLQAEHFGSRLEAANRELAGANRDLEEANRELEAANGELEAFSYSVSHDLKSPLRSIEGFSQILLEDYAGELDEEGLGHLGRVRAASRRMALLIEDLLDLSRVTRSALTRQTVDLSALAREIAAGLEGSEPGRGAEVVISDGLAADGDARLLRLALENLLGNAWKFTRKEPRPRIEFGAVERVAQRVAGRGGATDGATPTYFVRDNGVGFDEAYSEKLFGAFQRLHGQDEFEGTGIGLATVRRVVHRHGGRVWAESAPGEGATFYFTLGR